MRDVAREAGVSKALVSIVFRGVPGASEQSRAQVFAAAERLGYRPHRTASLLALRRTHQLGVVMDLHNAFHADLVDALGASAAEAGYHLVLSPWSTTLSEEHAIATALEFRCEALILIGSELPSDRITGLFGDLPVVSVGRDLPAQNADVVRYLEDLGMEEVVAHLVALGHRRIAHADGGSDETAERRRQGFERGLRRAGLFDADLVVRGGRSEADGRRAAAELLGRADPPTAITAFNDHCALGVLDAVARAGLAVPDDVAVTGFDDSPLARLAAVDLTTVHQEAPTMARWALTAAVERLDEGRRRPREAVLMPRLVIRGSSQLLDRSSDPRGEPVRH